jgi:hypothetical protein
VFSPGGADGRSIATGMFFADNRLVVVGRQTGLMFVYNNKLFLSSILLTLIMGSWPAQRCGCQKAREHDLPHGANESVEYLAKTVKSIKGRVVYSHDSSLADDVVVEVYEIMPEDKKLQTHEIVLRRECRAACVTAKDGSFCFVDLPSVHYVVRAGTRSANAGFSSTKV